MARKRITEGRHLLVLYCALYVVLFNCLLSLLYPSNHHLCQSSGEALTFIFRRDGIVFVILTNTDQFYASPLTYSDVRDTLLFYRQVTVSIQAMLILDST